MLISGKLIRELTRFVCACRNLSNYENITCQLYFFYDDFIDVALMYSWLTLNTFHTFFLVFLLLTLDRHIFTAEVYFKPYQTPIMEHFCENIKFSVATSFHKKLHLRT